MAQEEKTLVDKYLDYKKAEQEARSNSIKTLKELASLAPHKVGEIVKWTEHKRKNLGTLFHPNVVDLPPVEKKAVVTSVTADVWCFMTDKEPSLHYRYEFKPIKNGGGVSKNCCYPHKDYVWTGEIYDLNLDNR